MVNIPCETSPRHFEHAEVSTYLESVPKYSHHGAKSNSGCRLLVFVIEMSQYTLHTFLSAASGAKTKLCMPQINK